MIIVWKWRGITETFLQIRNTLFELIFSGTCSAVWQRPIRYQLTSTMDQWVVIDTNSVTSYRLNYFPIRWLTKKMWREPKDASSLDSFHWSDDCIHPVMWIRMNTESRNPKPTSKSWIRERNHLVCLTVHLNISVVWTFRTLPFRFCHRHLIFIHPETRWCKSEPPLSSFTDIWGVETA